ncbi:MAG TPA: lysophospholipid acyltransferase family protein [Candidatus Binatia bacterium]|nr:lysophospholipid acyltransferase family protein [Candidatus Binatia bacterium]
MMHVIDVPPRVPRWGNRFLAAFGRAVIDLLGWRLDIRLPDEPKFVVIAVPHTTNWEFVIGIAAIFAIRVRVNWWAKHSMFRWPFRGILQWAGGVPLDRARTRGSVPQMIEEMRSRPQFVLGLAPEGTRSRVEKWKSGFYQIAAGAQVPIVLAWMDYAKKECVVGPVIRPSGDYAADVARMLDVFNRVTPKHPQNWSGKA